MIKNSKLLSSGALLSLFISMQCSASLVWDRPESNSDSLAKQRTLEIKQIINQKLLEVRHQNLVVLNDISEIENRFGSYNTITTSLIYALLENKNILSSKAPVNNLLLMSKFWEDLITLDIGQLKNKHRFFLENITDEIILKLLAFAKSVNPLVDQNLQPKQELNMNHLFDDLKKQQTVYEAFFIFKLCKFRRIFNEYDIFEVNRDYVLLIPKKAILDAYRNSVIPDLINYTNDIPMDFLKNYLGIDFSNCRKINNIEIAPQFENYQVPTFYDLSIACKDALRKIMVSKYDLAKRGDFQGFLPTFNIFIGGHGSRDNQFVGIDEKTFEYILLYLQDHVVMKNLITFSCYPGGQRFAKFLGYLPEYSNGKIFNSLGYTIIFIGSLATSVYGKTLSHKWFRYAENFNVNIFTNIFEILEDKNINDEEKLRKYEKLFSELKIDSKFLSNYISIKFPHTGLIMASDYSKDVVNITNTKMFTLDNGVFHILENKKIVLLATNQILGTLFFDKPLDFTDDSVNFNVLPVDYKNNQYYISEMIFKSIQNLDWFDSSDQESDDDIDKSLIESYIGFLLSRMFSFDKQKIESPIFILIDKLIIKDSDNQENKIFKVLIDIKKQEIFFNYPQNDSSCSHKYTWQDDIIHSEDIDYNEKYDEIKQRMFAGYEPVYSKRFINELNRIYNAKSLPKNERRIPSAALHSREAYELEMSSRRPRKQHLLNPYAAEFFPKGKMVANAQGLNASTSNGSGQQRIAKKIVHNPYAKAKRDDKENQPHVLSTFDPRVNPFAKNTKGKAAAAKYS